MKRTLLHCFGSVLVGTALLLSASRMHAAQGLSREVWNNLDNPAENRIADRPAFFGPPFSLTTDPAFYAAPTVADIVLRAISSAVYAGSFGSRLRGYITAPATGDYTFWESGPDTVAVYLSIDENPNGKRLIVAHSALAPGQVRSGAQTSSPVRLQEGGKYYLEIIQKSDSSNGNLVLWWEAPGGQKQPVPESALETYAPPTSNPPGLSREFFPNLPGTSIKDLEDTPAFYRVPAATDVVAGSSFSGFGQNYAVRLRGFLIAPATGDYTFWESGGGDVSLSLATDDNSTAIHQSIRLNDRPNRRVIAQHNGSTAPLEWSKYRDQQSKPIRLIAGKKYYLEVIYKAGEGDDHVAIAWQTPGGTTELIPSSVLESYRRSPTDLDDDGMPDAIERAAGLDPADAADAAGDLDGDGIFNDEEIRAGANPAVKDSVPGIVLDDRWIGLPGNILDQAAMRAAFTRPIGERSASVALEIHGGGNRFLRRVRGYIIAPVRGEYTFWAGATGDSAFYLSTTASKFDRQLLIKTSGRIPYGRLDVNATQKSPPVSLVGGEKYYFEVWHKHADGHAVLNVAWQIPGEPRQIVPARCLASFAGDPNDMDDDYIEDDWERANGLNPADDGRTAGSTDGAFGRGDGSGLSNLQRYMLARSNGGNGSGASVYDQGNFYLSDFLAGAVGEFSEEAALTGGAFSASTGTWENRGGQAWQLGLRGAVTYGFTVASSGVHAVKFTVISRAGGAVDEGYDFRVSLNGKPISYQTITIPENGSSILAALTPWLNAGDNCQIELFVDNSYNYRRISVDGVKLLAATGVDSNKNGVPDWVEIRLNNTNGFDSQAISSRTSPATVEGRARYFDFLNTNGTAVTRAPNGRFFAEVPLTPGAASTLQFGFENGAISRTASVRWEPTNLKQQDRAVLTVRQGDSLLLTAFSSVNEAALETYSINVNGQTINGAGGHPTPVAFNTPGVQTIQLAHTAANGVATTSTVTVNVLRRVDFEPPLCITRFRRLWTHPTLPEGAELQLDENITAWREPIVNTWSLITTIPQDHPILVRHGAGGPILGGGVVNSVSVRSDDYTGYIHAGFAGPLARLSLPVVLTGDLQGAEIRCDIVIGGVTFPDGRTTGFLSSADFDPGGVASFTFLKPDSAHSACHLISFWKDGLLIVNWN